jgi:hypothetical protein
MKNLKKIILIGLLFLTYSCAEQKEYIVKLSFCDGREPLITTIKSSYKPSNRDIKVDGKAVSEFSVGCGCGGGSSEVFFNVCDVEVLEDVKINNNNTEEKKYEKRY